MVNRFNLINSTVVGVVLASAGLVATPALAQQCEVKIGTVGPMTGGGASWGLSEKAGVEFEAARALRQRELEWAQARVVSEQIARAREALLREFKTWGVSSGSDAQADAVLVRAPENFRSPRKVVEMINLLGLAGAQIEAHSGEVIKSTGDGIPTPSSATASGPTGMPACFAPFSINAGCTPSCSIAMPSYTKVPKQRLV